MVFQHQRSRGFQWWVETSWINHGMAIFMAFIIMAIVEIMGFKYVLIVFNHGLAFRGYNGGQMMEILKGVGPESVGDVNHCVGLSICFISGLTPCCVNG